MTWRTRRKVPSSPGSVKVTSSMNGRCGSRSARSRPVSSDSSASEPTATSRVGSASLRQIGSGVPQYRSRDSAQSTLLFSQSPYRPVLMFSGYQFVFSFSASSWSLICAGPDVPGRLRVVHQRRVAAPAVRIAVLVAQLPEQHAAVLQVLDQRGVRGLEEVAADERHVGQEVPGRRRSG